MIKAWLVGGDELVAKFTSFSDVFRDELQTCIKTLTMDLVKKVKEEKLSGQVLNRKTGRLSRSITPEFEFSANSAYGIVGTNVAYGRAWELGFTREVGAGARGGPRAMLEREKARYFAKHPPGNKTYAARPFLKSALDEMRDQIQEQIKDAVWQSVKRNFIA
jgi:phage gpG-like protein